MKDSKHVQISIAKVDRAAYDTGEHNCQEKERGRCKDGNEKKCKNGDVNKDFVVSLLIADNGRTRRDTRHLDVANPQEQLKEGGIHSWSKHQRDRRDELRGKETDGNRKPYRHDLFLYNISVLGLLRFWAKPFVLSDNALELTQFRL